MTRKPMKRTTKTRTAITVITLLSLVGLSACSASGANGNSAEQRSVTLLAYDAFTPQEGIFEPFTADTGIEVKIVTGGDTGTLVSKAILTAGNPEADVLWGVDNTFLARVQEAEVLDTIEPVDTGDVCINIHDDYFDKSGMRPPSSLADLIDPAYKDMLVVQDPRTSSPGLAFLLATIATFGESGWRDYWTQLRTNGVKVVSDWTSAYTVEFSGSTGKGSRPLVVSYGSSPPAEVLYSDPPVTEPPTSVMESSCFRQIEYVGRLKGTKRPKEADKLIEFLLGKTFQESMPLTLFVFPVNESAELPEVFEKFAIQPSNSLTIDADAIAANRELWIEQWADTAL